MERYASISSKLHHLSFITQQPTKSIGTLKTHKNVQMSNVKQHQVRSFLLTSLAVTSSFTMFENDQMSKYVNFVQYIYCFMHNVKLVHFLYIDATKNILFEKKNPFMVLCLRTIISKSNFLNFDQYIYCLIIKTLLFFSYNTLLVSLYNSNTKNIKSGC